MSKTHVVKLLITNNSGYALSDPTPWFDSGRVADGWSIPTKINSGSKAIVEMYEKDWSMAGCSGYITYHLNSGYVTFAFSNPVVGVNKLGCGTGGLSVWQNMDNHDYSPFSENFAINGVPFKANEQCSGGNVNEASVTLIVS